MMASESLVQSEDSAKLQKQTPPVTKQILPQTGQGQESYLGISLASATLSALLLARARKKN